MSEVGIVSIIALLGWLVLMIGSYRSFQVDASKTVRMALIWASIFAGITFFFTLIG